MEELTKISSSPSTVNGSGTLAIALDLSLIPLVHDYLAGNSLANCALKYNIAETEVSEFLSRQEVKRFISAQMANTGYAAKKKRIDLLSKIVDEKINLAEENDLPTSNKDIIEVLKLLREEENDLHKLSGDLDENTGKAQYIQIINSLKSD